MKTKLKGPGKGRGACDYRMGSKATKERRQKTAQACTEARAKRSPAQQLAVLNNRLGVNQGATKERKRLEALLPKEEE